MKDTVSREEAEAKIAAVKALQPGDKVYVRFSKDIPCVCGCTRSDSYFGTVVEDGDKRRAGTIRIMDSNGNRLSEFEWHIEPLDDDDDL